MISGRPRSIRLRATVATDVDPHAVLDLLLDLDRYVHVEPKLKLAEWLPGPTPPAVGSKVRLVAEVGFSLQLVTRLLGEPSGIATVTRWVPDRLIRCDLAAEAFSGWIEVRLPRDGAAIAVTGELVMASRTARIALRPLTSWLELRATRSIERVIRTACDAVRSETRN